MKHGVIDKISSFLEKKMVALSVIETMQAVGRELGPEQWALQVTKAIEDYWNGMSDHDAYFLLRDRVVN